MKLIDKKKVLKLIAEFEKAHFAYSLSVMGHFGKKKLKYADLKNGVWYWKGYNLHNLYLKYKNEY